MMRQPIEPFKIKVVEPIQMLDRKKREEACKRAGYNLFNLRSEEIFIDLLTDSGTSAMSQEQWSQLFLGDEAYAGAKSYYRLEEVVKDIFGFKHLIPCHQGRAAENILFSTALKKGDYVPNNAHFDTTRANIEHKGGIAVDLMPDEALDPQVIMDFKGNIDLDKLENFIKKIGKEKIPLGMLTITNNTTAGQPVSVENIRRTKEILSRYGIPLYIDACRWAENAYFVKQREKGYEDKSLKEIAREIFSYADGCTVSAKKDALANIGGFLCTNDDEVAKMAKKYLTLMEGFPTYGGMAGRDMDAIARGLIEALDERYIAYRVAQVAYLGERLAAEGVPVFKPFGGHAIYLDAKAFLPHIPQKNYPGQALAIELYLTAGIRAVEIGSVMFAKKDQKTGEMIYPMLDLVRLAIPRRVYTNTHIDYVAEAVIEVFKNRERVKGVRMTYDPGVLRHFHAHFEPL